MRDAAMVFELFDGPRKSPDDIEIGGLSSEQAGKRGVGGLAIQSRAANACAGKEMGDGFHRVVRSVIES